MKDDNNHDKKKFVYATAHTKSTGNNYTSGMLGQLMFNIIYLPKHNNGRT